ncbi:MAG: hypothetical protein QNJ23_05225 [Woeseiaceae bacterium]|nr:hypothetical protein [Woeseiaceae bacterium]
MLLASLMLLALNGCGGSSGGSPDPGPDPDPIIETRNVDLLNYVGASLVYVQAFSEGYTVPSAAALDLFDALVTDLLNQDFASVQSAAAATGFRLLRLIDTAADNNELYCLEETALQGQGFFCVDFDSPQSHHLSVPHPLYDRFTNTESVAIMRATGARFLSISSAHRCSNAATSSCSGTTSVCGAAGAYKVSDMAHTVDSFFYRFGVIVHDRSATTRTLQIHGCGSAACPANGDAADIVARLSAGTTADLPASELVNVLNAELNAQLASLQQGVSVSCSEPSIDKRLCGTTNTLGRYINGQPDPCENSATEFSGSRWLHIEQNLNLRQDDGAGDMVTPETLAEAINRTMEGS